MFTGIADVIKIPVAIVTGILIAALALVLFYEGLHLPIIGQVVKGSVQLRIDAATETMVTKFERDALAAQIDEERRRRVISEAAAAKAQERADATEIARQAAEAKIDELEAQARKDGLDTWSEKELQWYGHH